MASHYATLPPLLRPPLFTSTEAVIDYGSRFDTAFAFCLREWCAELCILPCLLRSGPRQWPSCARLARRLHPVRIYQQAPHALTLLELRRQVPDNCA